MHTLRDAIQRDRLITYACAITYQTQFGLRKRFCATDTGSSLKSATIKVRNNKEEVKNKTARQCLPFLELVARFVAKEMSVIVKPVSLLT